MRCPYCTAKLESFGPCGTSTIFKCHSCDCVVSLRVDKEPTIKNTGDLRQFVENELSTGGDWLGAARTWMQWNIFGGDRLDWSSQESVSIPFFKLQDLAQTAAVAAVMAERMRQR